MEKKKDKKKHKKEKTVYNKIQLDTKEVFNCILSFFNILDENEVGIDEITIHITSEKTGKSKKIHLFKDFLKFAKKLSKRNLK